MKKIYVIVGLLLLISINLSADDIMRPELITLEQFANEYIPDYTLKKRIPLECRRVNDIAVANNTGNIIAVTDGTVKYFDIEGKLLWKKGFNHVYIRYCFISENGKVITLHGWKKHTGNRNPRIYGSIVLNDKGDILFEKELDLDYLVPSPNGKYFTYAKAFTKKLVRIEKLKGIKILNQEGKDIDIKGFDYSNLVDIQLYFVTNKNIIMSAKDIAKSSTHFYFFKFENNNLTLLWKYEREKPNKNYSSSYFYKDVRVNQDKIIINTSSFPLNVFNFAGDLLYKDDEIHLDNFVFIDNENIYLQRTNYKPKIVNLKTKNVDEKPATGLPGLDNIFVKGNYFIFQKHSSTSIINKDTWNNFKHLAINSKNIRIKENEYYILSKTVDNPELLIYERSSK